MRKIIAWGVAALLVTTVAALATPAWEEKARSSWSKRDSQANLLKAIEIYENALAASPGEEALLVRLSIAYYWKGNNMDPSAKGERKAAYRKGMAYARQACDGNPKSIGGNFWYATNLASLSREIGIVKSASKMPEMKKHVEITMAQDEYYYHGGPQRFFARIIYKAPGFLRKSFGYKIEDAEKMLQEAIAKYPNFTMTHLFLADVYIEQEKINEARDELQKVLDTPVNVDPEFAPEARRDKRVAKQRLAALGSGK